MSVKIRVSYTDDQELTELIRTLSHMVASCKVQDAKGKYKRAYVQIKSNGSLNKYKGKRRSNE